ncbi:hypothetical protein P7K49_027207 [Saguinus oedipus]|uniref:PLAT domain-containing protein n=1 Tax=Saguinus oedipus TaxID=9490 RepID=A0ABQ9UFK7_SAGOE|nr:hypothetical protein P7K49_027207 [Saguinus oedipus]
MSLNSSVTVDRYHCAAMGPDSRGPQTASPGFFVEGLQDASPGWMHIMKYDKYLKVIFTGLLSVKGTWKNMKTFTRKEENVVGNGWFLGSIVVKSEDEDSSEEVLFPCNRWLDEYQDDGKTQRELLAESSSSAGGQTGSVIS